MTSCRKLKKLPQKTTFSSVFYFFMEMSWINQTTCISLPFKSLVPYFPIFKGKKKLNIANSKKFVSGTHIFIQQYHKDAVIA